MTSFGKIVQHTQKSLINLLNADDCRIFFNQKNDDSKVYYWKEKKELNFKGEIEKCWEKVVFDRKGGGMFEDCFNQGKASCSINPSNNCSFNRKKAHKSNLFSKIRFGRPSSTFVISDPFERK
jgi:hypothetical protein